MKTDIDEAESEQGKRTDILCSSKGTKLDNNGLKRNKVIQAVKGFYRRKAGSPGRKRHRYRNARPRQASPPRPPVHEGALIRNTQSFSPQE